ncbi:N-formylglutamate deformylase [Burkholderia thailandensis]|nr:N-formylglutamate deformylase [Burkholderia thailandensis]AHI73776.1 N-formylglutamate deformylase [Burkholderia thailandensis 2002721723]AIP24802.1 N-formylglutamate deformylase [Burkholderia thailandensis E264]AIS95343.1 N-formylglutamate deformylase [Burkholderia thailandensis MSMB59]AJX99268.1 N-formylglutamate deformylase [Burkholderia thailandensis 2002721643]AOJ47024.1 N-formylglutamate deformylase [Burkholderia thailandensis]
MNTASHPPVITLHRGTLPLLVSIPHAGTHIPDDIAATMTPVARHVDDCDWHLERLYDFAKALGASVLVPSHARYVVDLNRPPDDANLYPGQDTTGLVPVDTFDKAPLYAPGSEPTVAEIARRRERYWVPYHDALAGELQRLTDAYGRALLWEAHSIRSHVPRFFDGRLPDFNFGTSNGASAAPGLADKLAALVERHGGYTSIANGRFKGGYITRHYGAPERGVQAVQLELVQATYMDEARPYSYDEAKAQRIAPLLEALVKTALEHR